LVGRRIVGAGKEALAHAAWATACSWNGDKAKSKVSRILERLKEDKLVTRTRKGWVLTNLGKDEARIDRNW
jgi:hypothetical protein